MAMLDILIQIITDWTRDVLAGVLGRRAEELVGKCIKRSRRKLSHGTDARSTEVPRKFKQ